MMISPESFYESEIKGKDRDGILRVISRLKREIAQLKHTMEHPNYGTEVIIHPDESTQLWCMRLYLERAKKALDELGESYKPTAAELRVMDFDANIGNISKITLNIGGFNRCWRTYSVQLDNRLQYWFDDTPRPVPANSDISSDFPMTKEEFLEKFADLHVGEWRKHYDSERFGCVVFDGTQWNLTIEYGNGRKAFIRTGDNCFPYNFRELTDLFGMDDDDWQ